MEYCGVLPCYCEIDFVDALIILCAFLKKKKKENIYFNKPMSNVLLQTAIRKLSSF